MKTSFTSIVALLVTLSLTASTFACGGNRGGNNGGGYGGNGGYNGQCQTNGGYSPYGQSPYGQSSPYGQVGQNGPFGGQAYEPFHSSYICQPGDSFYTVSLKEYGTSNNMQSIAQFNRLPVNAALVPGQRLVLPSIAANGQLGPSRAPAAEGDYTPVQGPFGNPTAKFAQPNPITSFAAPAPKEQLPSVATGSSLSLDGQQYGAEKGVVRLRVNNVALPVEVLDWSTTSAKVRLPQIDVTGSTKAVIEVVRADGSLASTSAVELTPATVGLARN